MFPFLAFLKQNNSKYTPVYQAQPYIPVFQRLDRVANNFILTNIIQ